MKPIKVFMIEDHLSFADSLGLYFNQDPRFQYSGAGNTEEKAFAKTENMDIDLFLLDIELGGEKFGGFKIAANLQNLFKNKILKPKIIFLSGYCTLPYREQAMSLNCSLLSKSARIPEVITKLIEIMTNNKLIIDYPEVLIRTKPSEEATKENERELERQKYSDFLRKNLTPKEGVTVLHVYKYPTNAEAAKQLNISKHTVENRLKSTYRKLHFNKGTTNRHKLIKLIGNSTLPNSFSEIKAQPEKWFKG